ISVAISYSSLNSLEMKAYFLIKPIKKWYKKATVEEFRSIDVRRWQREGYRAAGSAGNGRATAKRWHPSRSGPSQTA
ncbi:MAG: hypothetical protein RKP20_11430, partial [Candidatus Competibacter sp.]|nr:hypothetical protein [Candidatus Competibacter sp.]